MTSDTAWLHKAMDALSRGDYEREDRLTMARKLMCYVTACDTGTDILNAHGGEVMELIAGTILEAYPTGGKVPIQSPGISPESLLSLWDKMTHNNRNSSNNTSSARTFAKRPLDQPPIQPLTKRKDAMKLFKPDSPIPAPVNLPPKQPSSSSLFGGGGKHNGTNNNNNNNNNSNLYPSGGVPQAISTYPTSGLREGAAEVFQPSNVGGFGSYSNSADGRPPDDRTGGSALRNLHSHNHDDNNGSSRHHPKDSLPPPPNRNGGAEEAQMGFVSAARQLEVEDMKKGKMPERRRQGKTLGVKRFVPPFRKTDIEREVANQNNYNNNKGGGGTKRDREEPDKEKDAAAGIPPELLDADGNVPEKLKNIDPELLTTINNEILESSYVAWNDIAGLEYAKRAVYEAIIWPLERPDLFDGIRGPTKGLLLFGPPGTGKTMIGKAIASESQSTFFNISASTLMSKWVGEGEKMVRALFAVASVKQPSVVFIDEIDSLLTQRCDGEQDHTRRLKTEFLVQLDGAGTCSLDRILIVGATNRPQELDEAARRRMEKRLYIPLPEESGRAVLVTSLLKTVPNSITETELAQIVKKSKGYSGADLKILCREAAFVSLREQGDKIKQVDREAVRPVSLRDFAYAFNSVKPTVSEDDIKCHTRFNDEYGSFGTDKEIKSSDIDHFFDDV